ncbi:MAG: hybrid sensor histidine kinase/response regulator [Thermodesulfobacteriota bacterium]|nr:hybrid sensor histidine kinase/response regulator [Thermodesulfobacteriota bacterium]
MDRIEGRKCQFHDTEILVVDDNQETLELAVINLQMEGYKVFSALDGEKALEKAEMIPDVILLDLMMPGIDGFEVCKKLKSNHLTEDIMVIILTAKTSTDDVLRAFDMGADEYITKPFKVEELLARVRSVIRIKRSRDELKRLNEVLEEKVEQKTVLLKEANRRLLTLEKAKSDFISLLIHELRTPLSSIIGFSELLLEELTSEEQKNSCEMILEAGNQLLKLSDTATLLMALKAEQYDMNMETIQVFDLLQDAVFFMDSKAKEKDIELVQDILLHNEKVKADFRLMARSLTDILDNAIQFSPQGGQVVIRTAVDRQDVLLEIMDNGPGFTAQMLVQMFRLFSVSEINHHHSGLGLSLAIAKIIMDLHEGKIEAENRPEGGAVVRLRLPVISEVA